MQSENFNKTLGETEGGWISRAGDVININFGTGVTMRVAPYILGAVLDVYIQLPPVYHGRVGGLCGAFGMHGIDQDSQQVSSCVAVNASHTIN